jgi:hypothetical protein
MFCVTLCVQQTLQHYLPVLQLCALNEVDVFPSKSCSNSLSCCFLVGPQCSTKAAIPASCWKRRCQLFIFGFEVLQRIDTMLASRLDSMLVKAGAATIRKSSVLTAVQLAPMRRNFRTFVAASPVETVSSNSCSLPAGKPLHQYRLLLQPGPVGLSRVLSNQPAAA